MAEKRSVPVVDKSHRIYGIDDNGDKLALGTMKVRMFEGESTYRNSFLSQVETEEKLLTPTKNQWVPLDHYTALQPLINEGYELQTRGISRGGTKMTALLTNPNGQTLRDIFTWDADFWGEGNVGKDGGIQEAVFFTNNILPGGGVHYRHGFFRFVCTNGMYDAAWELPSIRMNSENFSIDRLASDLFGVDVHVTEEQLRGPKVGSPVGAGKFSNFISEWYLNPENNLREDMPEFAQEMTKPFDSIPEWIGVNAVHQFETLAKTHKNVHRQDVRTAWTNAVNLGREEGDASNARGLHKMDALTKAASNLISVYSM